MFREFREFAMRGSVIDMAVGIVIGAAFTSIVKSLVADVIMPPVGLLLGGVDFSNLFLVLREGAGGGDYVTLGEAQAAGAVTLNYGLFLNQLISFLIVAWAVFLLVRGVNRLKRRTQTLPPAEPTTRDCPRCFSTINLRATRCPHCTSDIPAGG